ncbi:MAG: hypothetical protein WAX07_07405 [Candidatus Altiarchaeia archaeon]
MKRTTALLLAVLVLSAFLFAGCTGKSGEKENSETTLPAGEDTSSDVVQELTDADIPLIAENDTVEIGEML